MSSGFGNQGQTTCIKLGYKNRPHIGMAKRWCGHLIQVATLEQYTDDGFGTLITGHSIAGACHLIGGHVIGVLLWIQSS